MLIDGTHLTMFSTAEESVDHWKLQHNRALRAPNNQERGIVMLMKAWWEIAVQHGQRYDSHIGEDGVLGPAFVDIVQGFRTLLNGETGRLDCGRLDGFVCEMLKACGEEV